MTDILNNWMTRLWDFIDQRGVIRRTITAAAIFMLWKAGENSFTYAMAALAAGKADAGVAAVIAAIGVPATAFAGYVFKAYLESRA
jgi:hypothetical protein